jgi:hypothetical protein
MGLNYEKMVKDYIGELTYSEDSSSPKISLPCEIIQEGNLSFVLCNKKGKTRCEKSMPVSKGKTVMEFQISALKDGEYNAWIEVNGQTHLRNILIDNAQKNSDFFSRIKNWF